jgi:hypothetical protein
VSQLPRPATGGERDLTRLLAHASPRVQPGEWVFVVTTPAALDSLAPIGTFCETEGLTAICPRERADACGLGYDGVFRQITMTIHSSLHAVGFLAALSRALAVAGIPCNVVSAAHHDHLFVPAARIDEALRALQSPLGP